MSSKGEVGATRARLLSRAVDLSRLAVENLDFLRERSFGSPAGLREAHGALTGLLRFLTRNRAAFADATAQTAGVLEHETARLRKEVRALEAAMRDEHRREERAQIEGQINLSNLRLLRLRELAGDYRRIASFFEEEQLRRMAERARAPSGRRHGR
ncbi:MAG: hypothetical protein ACRDGE_03485 [Candidatus Limnocylindria bacterium]